MTLKAGRRRVRISNPDKVLFPDDGITKEDLARYYAAVAPAMVPHVRDRPLNLWRWNRGIENELVIQQAIPKGAPDWVKRVTVPRRRGGDVTHAVGGEAATLVWLANQNCVTPHVWTARADKPDQPDRLVFDFDPPDDGDTHLEAIRAGALAVGDLLREHGLTPYAMTSGSRGIHVVAPLRRGPDSDTVRTRAGELAEELAGRLPDQLTTSWRKEGRGGSRARRRGAQHLRADGGGAVCGARQAGRAGGHAAVLGRGRGCRAAGLDVARRAGAAGGARRSVGGDRCCCRVAAGGRQRLPTPPQLTFRAARPAAARRARPRRAGARAPARA